MAAWLHHHHPEDDLYSGILAASLPPPVLRDSTESCLTPATITRTFAVPGLSRKPTEPIFVSLAPWIPVHTFVVPGLGRKETEPIQKQPAHDRKREERVETIKETEKETGHRSTTRKRSRDAEMHNLSERRRRERINDRLRALQELMPRCNKSYKASMLDDAVEYMKSLQMQVQMMSSMMPVMYMQRFMPHMAMGMKQPPYIPLPGIPPFPSQAHMAGLGPSYPVPRSPFPNIQAFDPSRFHIPPSHQPQFPGYWNPYGQFVGPPQIQQPPPLHNQTITSQPSFGQASNNKEPEDEEKQPTDY